MNAEFKVDQILETEMWADATRKCLMLPGPLLMYIMQFYGDDKDDLLNEGTPAKRIKVRIAISIAEMETVTPPQHVIDNRD